MFRSRVAPLLMAGFLLLALMLPAAPVQAGPGRPHPYRKRLGADGDLEGG